MELLGLAGRRAAHAMLLLLTGVLLHACVANPAPVQVQRLTGSANPIGVQTGRLTVVALDSVDGLPLNRAVVEILSADVSVRDPTYYRRVNVTNRMGMVTFSDVPSTVNIAITHSRGTYGRDNYPVPQGAPSEFRALIDTLVPRTRDE